MPTTTQKLVLFDSKCKKKRRLQNKGVSFDLFLEVQEKMGPRRRTPVTRFKWSWTSVSTISKHISYSFKVANIKPGSLGVKLYIVRK